MGYITQEEAAFWAGVREQFYLTPGRVFFNGGSVGPAARPTIERVIDLLRTFESDPLHHQGHTLHPLVESAREKLATFVGTHPDRIAFVQNTTMGMNVPAQGLDFERGSEIVMSDQEYPSVRNVWRYIAERQGLTIREVPLPTPPDDPHEIVDAFASGITPKTRVLVFSHVYFTTGLVAPIQALSHVAREHDALAVIDGAHAVGMVPLNLDEVGCHFYVSSCHKWLLAPKGVGMLYIAEKFQNKVRPLIVGFNQEPSPMASRYDMQGTRDHTHVAGLGTAIDFQAEIGWETKIRPYCLGLARYLKERTREIEGSYLRVPLDPVMSGFITTFGIDGVNVGAISGRLWNDYQIETSCTNVDGVTGFRISTHFYNSYEDVDRFIDAVQEVFSQIRSEREK